MDCVLTAVKQTKQNTSHLKMAVSEVMEPMAIQKFVQELLIHILMMLACKQVIMLQIKKVECVSA